MKTTMKIFAAALAMSVIGAAAAEAQPANPRFGRDGGYERFDDRRGDRFDRRDNDRRNYGQTGRYDRRYDRNDWREYRQGRQAYRYDRNEFRRFHRGQRFSYHPHRHVVVHDWHRYRLHAPPRGYHWVRNGNSGDFLLVAITTGLILELMFGGY